MHSIASPKDEKRSVAGARRVTEDARAVALNLAAASDAQNQNTEVPTINASSSSSTPEEAGAILEDTGRHRRGLARLARYAAWGDGVKGFFEPGLLPLYLSLDGGARQS